MGERGKFFFRLDNFLCCVKMNDGLLLTGLWSVINAALCVATISLCFFSLFGMYYGLFHSLLLPRCNAIATRMRVPWSSLLSWSFSCVACVQLAFVTTRRSLYDCAKSVLHLYRGKTVVLLRRRRTGWPCLTNSHNLNAMRTR